MTDDPRKSIFPTFTCFTDAMEFIAYIHAHCPEMKDEMTLVHGICVAEGDKEYAHAWVEDSEAVIFCGIWMGRKTYFCAPFKNYFETFKVKESTRYTVEEAAKMNLKTVSYGPWEKKYDALCGDGENTVLGGGHIENVTYLGHLKTQPQPKQPKKGKRQ